MKKFLLTFGIAVFSIGMAQAQTHDHSGHEGHDHDNAAKGGVVSSNTLTVENMKFDMDAHDFGTVPEGPAAEHTFTFTNTGDEPINLQTVKASCGCTTPSWSKEPVLPGQKGEIKASYATQRRPGNFTKSITVVSDAGTKVLTIKGNVEPAPTGSVPTASKSMIQK